MASFSIRSILVPVLIAYTGRVSYLVGFWLKIAKTESRGTFFAPHRGYPRRGVPCLQICIVYANFVKIWVNVVNFVAANLKKRKKYEYKSRLQTNVNLKFTIWSNFRLIAYLEKLVPIVLWLTMTVSKIFRDNQSEYKKSYFLNN